MLANVSPASRLANGFLELMLCQLGFAAKIDPLRHRTFAAIAATLGELPLKLGYRRRAAMRFVLSFRISLAHRFKLPGIRCGVCAKQAPSNSFLNERERLLGIPRFYFSSLSPELCCYQPLFLSFNARLGLC